MVKTVGVHCVNCGEPSQQPLCPSCDASLPELPSEVTKTELITVMQQMMQRFNRVPSPRH